MAPTIQLLRRHAMRLALVALGPALFALAAVTSPDVLAEGIQEDAKPGLTIAIKPTRVESGTAVVERAGGFEVLFTNQSDKPIRIWDESCQLGHGTLSFRVVDASGQSWSASRCDWKGYNWKEYPTKAIAIPPGGVFAWKVRFAESKDWRRYGWIGAPEANTGKAIKLTAVFEVKPSDGAKEHGVWTGRIESKASELLVVDAKLKTPEDYLIAGCPKQAIKLIESDRKLLNAQGHRRQTPLHIAVLCGHTEAAKWLLENGADVAARAYNQFTPLHFARDPEMMKLLLKHKADVNAKNVSGRTELEELASDWAHFGTVPSLLAEREGLLILIKLLLAAGADYDIRSAAYLDDVERVRALLSADKKLAGDKYALRQAAEYGRIEIVKLLLAHGADPEDGDYGGLTISYFAIKHADVLKLLFDAGANPKVDVTYRGNGRGPAGSTLTHEAAERGTLESLKLLVARGLDVNAADPFGFTPLHCACAKGHAAMVESLLQYKADPKARTQEGWTPMFAASYQIRPEQEEDNLRFQAVIRALEKHGVELDLFAAIVCNDVKRVAAIMRTEPKAGATKDPRGRPALHRAVTLDRQEIVKRFLEGGCNPDVPSEDENGYKGETALLNAAFWGRVEITKLLIQHRADVNAAAERGIVPLHEAVRMGNLEVARMLIAHGAKVNAKDNEGKTPLDWVDSFSKSAEMTKLLRDHGAVKKP